MHLGFCGVFIIGAAVFCLNHIIWVILPHGVTPGLHTSPTHWSQRPTQVVHMTTPTLISLPLSSTRLFFYQLPSRQSWQRFSMGCITHQPSPGSCGSCPPSTLLFWTSSKFTLFTEGIFYQPLCLLSPWSVNFHGWRYLLPHIIDWYWISLPRVIQYPHLKLCGNSTPRHHKYFSVWSILFAVSCAIGN